MGRPIPNNKVVGVYGTANPSAPVRQTSLPLQVPRGSPQRREQFTDPSVPPVVARALVSMQSAVDQATGQAKGILFARHNVVRNVTLTNGTANGGNPNVVQHGLGRRADGYVILAPRGGYVTNHSLIANASASEDRGIIRIWTQRTLFAGSSSVVCDFLVYTLQG